MVVLLVAEGDLFLAFPAQGFAVPTRIRCCTVRGSNGCMALDLREAADDPEWQYVSREELIREEKKGHQSLREEYE